LITVICLALLVFCLVERQVRQALAEQSETRIEGLYAGRAAGRLIFAALAPMKIIPSAGHSPPVIPQPTTLNYGYSTCSTSTPETSADDHPRAENGARCTAQAGRSRLCDDTA
jgi:hypothetical protein